MGLLPTLTGTYDVLTIPLLLPTKTVESLLPPQYQNCTPSLLLATPDHFLTSIPCSSGALPTADAKKQYHLVLLQLGHQQHTGPGPFKMTFQEAKLEIPFVRHPKASEASDKGRREFLFKQKCLFSNPIIYSGSQYMTGLNSAVATFTPSDSPYSFAAQADTMEYVAMGYFDVTGTISQDAAAEQEVRESSQDVLKLAEVPWFGDRTGDTITQFDFDQPSIGPTAYNVTGTLHLGAFSQDVEPKELVFKSVGYRSRCAFKATESKLNK